MDAKIGVVGEKDSIGCFRSLGLEVFEAEGHRDIERAINRMAKEQYAVIFITEHAAMQVTETIYRYQSIPYPAIIPIPSNQGSMGIGMENIRKNVEKAIGTELFFDD